MATAEKSGQRKGIEKTLEEVRAQYEADTQMITEYIAALRFAAELHKGLNHEKGEA